MYGLSQTGLLEIKTSEQNALKQKMKDAGADIAFFDKIDSLYAIRLKNAGADLITEQFHQAGMAISNALKLRAYKTQMKVIPKKSDTAFWKKWKNEKAPQIFTYTSTDKELDMLVLAEIIKRVKNLPADRQIKALKRIKDPETWVRKAYEKSILDDAEPLKTTVDSEPNKLFKSKDPLLKLAEELGPVLDEILNRNTGIKNQLNNLLPNLLEARMKYDQKKFIPDANATLRFTYGYISGYKQGLNKHPLPYTYRKEIFEKNASDHEDYRLSAPVKELLLKDKIAQELLDAETGDLVICMLYNMDTTGGNSGSPVMDADGNLVGVNFDRAYTATLNDYSWNTDYSRSIAVDIRYVIFTMKYLNGADNLLSEMGVKI
jgi:hypothetical protein